MTLHLSSAALKHSLAAIQEELVIFCVGQELRRVAAFRAWAAYRRLNVRSLVGCYRGATEMSFVIGTADYAEVAAWTRAEESVLLLGRVDRNGVRPARLVFADGRAEDLGHFVTCSRETALACSSWTYDPVADEHFICVNDTDDKVIRLPVPCVEPSAFQGTGSAN
jgi:hypothetical protein